MRRGRRQPHGDPGGERSRRRGGEPRSATRAGHGCGRDAREPAPARRARRRRARSAPTCARRAASTPPGIDLAERGGGGARSSTRTGPFTGVIHAAAYTAVDAAEEREPDVARRVNADASRRRSAEACARRGARARRRRHRLRLRRRRATRPTRGRRRRTALAPTGGPSSPASAPRCATHPDGTRHRAHAVALRAARQALPAARSSRLARERGELQGRRRPDRLADVDARARARAVGRARSAATAGVYHARLRGLVHAGTASRARSSRARRRRATSRSRPCTTAEFPRPARAPGLQRARLLAPRRACAAAARARGATALADFLPNPARRTARHDHDRPRHRRRRLHRLQLRAPAASSERPDWRVVNLDALTYAGNLENLSDVEAHPRYRFVHGDIARPRTSTRAFERRRGAERRSCTSPPRATSTARSVSGLPFVRTNVLGTQVLLDAARAARRRALRAGLDRRGLRLARRARAASPRRRRSRRTRPTRPARPRATCSCAPPYHTHGFPACITRCSNNYGPYQFPEKLIPLMITNALEDKPLPVYGDGMNVRDWLYVEDHCEALLAVLERGHAGRGLQHRRQQRVRRTSAIVRRILAELGKPESLIRYVNDRPGHDRRYAIDASKIRARAGLGARASTSSTALPPDRSPGTSHKTHWLQRVRSGAYREYYARQYGGREAAAVNPRGQAVDGYSLADCPGACPAEPSAPESPRGFAPCPHDRRLPFAPRRGSRRPRWRRPVRLRQHRSPTSACCST